MRKIVVLVGPSGSGKTSLANWAVTQGFYKPITCTTRNKRDGEVEGVDYFFLSVEAFKNKIKFEQMADYDEAFGTFYGVEKSQFNICNSDIIIPATFKGVANLKRYFSNVVSIFLKPPSEAKLIERMRLRNMSQTLIDERVNSFRFEMLHMSKCDYIVSTDQAISKSCAELGMIIL
ncbi:MAG: hypothetical protein H6845_00670 [Alphaproteobacteria bacterium]|nr:MAG: hypothetical protein H6845_00670 [Alphaproteobacteria bacterium]